MSLCFVICRRVLLNVVVFSEMSCFVKCRYVLLNIVYKWQLILFIVNDAVLSLYILCFYFEEQRSSATSFFIAHVRLSATVSSLRHVHVAPELAVAERSIEDELLADRAPTLCPWKQKEVGGDKWFVHPNE